MRSQMIGTGRWVVGTLLALFTLSSCGGSGAATKDPARLLDEVRRSYATPVDLTLKGTMKVTGLPATIWFEAFVKGRDSLKMVLNGPFGMAVGALAATPERFTFLNLFEGVAYTGTPDRATLLQASRLEISYDEIVSLMRSQAPRLPTAEELASGAATAESDDGDVRYTMTSGSMTETVTIDPDNRTIVEYRQTEGSGDASRTLLLVTYKDFHLKAGDRVFPESATSVFDDGERTVRVTVERLSGSVEKDVTMTLDVPAGMDVEAL